MTNIFSNMRLTKGKIALWGLALVALVTLNLPKM